MLSVHEKGGARGPRELEETVLAARRYEGSLNLTDIVAAANIAGHELDGPRCEIRMFLTKFDVWNPSSTPRSLPCAIALLTAASRWHLLADYEATLNDLERSFPGFNATYQVPEAV